MKHALFVVAALSLAGCATNVADPRMVLGDGNGQACYVYDTEGRAGTRFGFVPNLITLAMVAAIETANLPNRCGLTVQEAQTEALALAYTENSDTIYRERRDDNALVLRVDPIDHTGACMQARYTVSRVTDNAATVRNARYIEVCRDPGAAPRIARDNVPESEIKFPPLPPHRPEY